MATKTGWATLNERLMRAAEALLQPAGQGQPEAIEVSYTDGEGVLRNWLLRGRAIDAAHVRLCIWCEASQWVEIAAMSAVTLGPVALARLEEVARFQETPGPGVVCRGAEGRCMFGDSVEEGNAVMERLRSIAAAVTAHHAQKWQRDLGGRFAVSTCERRAR